MATEGVFPHEDLRHILEQTRPVWPHLQQARIFFTGGTGFVGRWLLAALLEAHDAGLVDGQVTVLTRRPQEFHHDWPQLAGHRCVELQQGDVLSFTPPDGSWTHIVHGATQASAQLARDDPALMLATITEGTRQVLEWAHALAQPPRLLYLSSGAVYGVQPPEVEHLSEEFEVGAKADNNPYAQGKRAAEELCRQHHENGLPVVIARLFAFSGPGLPLEAHFAAGNFMRDALHGGPIEVAGDGCTWRSYLYAADLAVWLWRLLVQGDPGRAYNVGSDRPVTIAQLAHTAAGLCRPPLEVQIRQSPGSGPAPRYVPDTTRAREELGLQQWISLEDGLHRWLGWLQL